MTLILFYVAFMISGDLAAYLLGLLVEYEFGTHVVKSESCWINELGMR